MKRVEKHEFKNFILPPHLMNQQPHTTNMKVEVNITNGKFHTIATKQKVLSMNQQQQHVKGRVQSKYLSYMDQSLIYRR
jgi:hypothetical protein